MTAVGSRGQPSGGYAVRNPARIDQVLGLLREVWTRSPDLRLGQLIVNAARPGHPCPEVFAIEGTVLARRLEGMLRPGRESAGGGWGSSVRGRSACAPLSRVSRHSPAALTTACCRATGLTSGQGRRPGRAAGRAGGPSVPEPRCPGPAGRPSRGRAGGRPRGRRPAVPGPCGVEPGGPPPGRRRGPTRRSAAGPDRRPGPGRGGVPRPRAAVVPGRRLLPSPRPVSPTAGLPGFSPSCSSALWTELGFTPVNVMTVSCAFCPRGAG